MLLACELTPWQIEFGFFGAPVATSKQVVISFKFASTVIQPHSLLSSEGPGTVVCRHSQHLDT